MIKIELRKVKHLKSLSEETPAYTAQLWVDGAHFADVSNHGQGGCDEQHAPRGSKLSGAAFHDELRKISALVAAQYPKIDCSTFGGKGMLDRDLDTVCHELIEQQALAKSVTRDLQKKVMFVKPEDGKVYGIKVANEVERTQTCLFLTQHKGVKKILNMMPLDEAISLLVGGAS